MEACVNEVVEVIELLNHLVLRRGWQDELHCVNSANHILVTREGLLNVSHGDLLVSLGGLGDDSDTVVVELDNGLHHAHGLVEWTVVVVLGERVLLQELILDDLGSLLTKDKRYVSMTESREILSGEKEKSKKFNLP